MKPAGQTLEDLADAWLHGLSSCRPPGMIAPSLSHAVCRNCQSPGILNLVTAMAELVQLSADEPADKKKDDAVKESADATAAHLHCSCCGCCVWSASCSNPTMFLHEWKLCMQTRCGWRSPGFAAAKAVGADTPKPRMEASSAGKPARESGIPTFT